MGNFLVPLAALPYLMRTLGAEAYGEVVWIQTVMLFGNIWVDFGFGWSATREISANRHIIKQVAHLSANVWAIQWCLMLVFSVGVVVLSFIWAESNGWVLYAAGLGVVLGQLLLPIWLFQGLEKLTELALVQMAGRLFALPMVFLWVNGPNDQVWALIFFSFSSIIVGILAMGWVLYRGLVQPVMPQRVNMWCIFKEGSILFSSRALISLYTTLIPLAVGWWGGPLQLAYFNLADRFRQAVQSLLTPVSQAIFPRMSWLFQHDPTSARSLLGKSAMSMGILSVFAGVILWFGAEYWMTILGGRDFGRGAAVLRWLAFVPCIVAMSNLMGLQIMLPSGMNRQFTLILGISSLMCLIFLYPIINHSGAEGAAQLVLLVECVVTASMAIYLWRKWRRKE